MVVHPSDKVTLTCMYKHPPFDQVQQLAMQRVVLSAELLRWFLTTDFVNFCCGSCVLFHPLLPFKA